MPYLKYVGKKQEKHDDLYGTKTVWGPGVIQLIEDRAAAKMLQHTDVWALATEEDVAECGLAPKAIPVTAESVVIEEEPAEVEDDARLHDVNVSTMTKAQMIQYAARSFNVSLDGSSTIQELRAKVKQIRELNGIRRGAQQ